MSEDFVNNITLNYLISKSQLNKLNKAKQVKDNNVKNEKELYKNEIMTIFSELMEKDNSCVNVLQEVKNGFEYFVEKTIYHIKMQKMTQEQEESRGKHNEKIIVTKSSSSCSEDNPHDKDNIDNNYEDFDEDFDEDVDEYEDEDEEIDETHFETNINRCYDYKEKSDDYHYNSKCNISDISNDDVDVCVNVYHNTVGNLVKKETQQETTTVYKKYPEKYNWFDMVKNEKKSNKIVPRVK